MHSKLSSALIAEFIGTFALIFIGAGAGAIGQAGLVGVAFAHGLVIFGFAYAYGHISGTHLNPAVTIGLWAGRQVETARAIGYIVAQILGGIAGAYALKALAGPHGGNLGVTTLAAGIDPALGMLIELVLTFFLVNAVYNAAVSGKAGNMAGAAIGLTLAFCILMGGPLTGASLNPARTLGPAIAAGVFDNLWVYLVGPPLGGILAAVVYRTVLAER